MCMVRSIAMTLQYTPTYFFTSAGMETENAFYLSLGAKAMAFIGTLL